MDRLHAYLDQLLERHEYLVKSGATWAEESFCLGEISAVRKAMTILNSPGSTIPADQIA